jgi:hypothetical protein
MLLLNDIQAKQAGCSYTSAGAVPSAGSPRSQPEWDYSGRGWGSRASKSSAMQIIDMCNNILKHESGA